MTASTMDFLTWFHSAQPNDRFIYHVGTNLSCPEANADTVDLVRQFYNEGKIELVQRAIGAAYSTKLRNFEHMVVKRDKIAKPSSFLDRVPRMALAA